MEQSEKLDLILKGLYDFRFDGNYYSIREILENMGVDINQMEALDLGRRLKDAGYIKFLPMQSTVSATLTSEGVQYCESDSFTFRGSSIITNNYHLSITNSPGANIVSHSQNVSITNQIESASSIVNEIIEKINSDISISDSRKIEIQSCAEEITNNLKAGLIPKFGISSLISLVGDISSVASLALALSQLL